MMDFNKESSHGCPCKPCPKKGCGSYHDVCPEYRTWRKELDEKNHAERLRHQSNDTMSNAKKKSIWKGKRYSRQIRYTRKIDTK